jgi:hypothetical protein
LKLAQTGAAAFLAGNMSFKQTKALAEILGCHEKASEFGRAPQTENNVMKLDQQIKSCLATEWETVLKGEHFIYVYNY